MVLSTDAHFYAANQDDNYLDDFEGDSGDKGPHIEIGGPSTPIPPPKWRVKNLVNLLGTDPPYSSGAILGSNPDADFYAPVSMPVSIGISDGGNLFSSFVDPIVGGTGGGPGVATSSTPLAATATAVLAPVAQAVNTVAPTRQHKVAWIIAIVLVWWFFFKE